MENKVCTKYKTTLLGLICDMVISLIINFRGYFLVRTTARGWRPGIYIYKPEYKFCTKCKKEQSLKEFHLNKSSGDGKNSHCKKCRNKHNAEYRNTPERQTAGKEYNKRYDSEYYHQHKAAIVESGKRSYKKRWARRKKYNDEYCEKNIENYIIKQLTKDSDLERGDIPKELISLHKIVLLAKKERR